MDGIGGCTLTTSTLGGPKTEGGRKEEGFSLFRETVKEGRERGGGGEGRTCSINDTPFAE